MCYPEISQQSTFSSKETVMASHAKTVVGTGVATTGIDHVVLHVADLKKSVDFYVNVLGLTEHHGGDGFMFLNCGTQLVGLFETSHGQDVNDGPDLNHMAFNAADSNYDTVKSTLESQGVAVRARDGDPRCVYFDDPDGHTLQINVQ
jgi:catechol 2,3-dioxygenase-like lactoylglutathione lyase family enzyme